eukprot:8428564-Pyramimonas_sp.AAC.1
MAPTPGSSSATRPTAGPALKKSIFMALATLNRARKYLATGEVFGTMHVVHGAERLGLLEFLDK